jgi:hypothetical protein
MLDVDVERRLELVPERDEVPNLPLEADVRYKAVSGLRIQARLIPCVGITVGVAERYVEEQDKIMTPIDRVSVRTHVVSFCFLK